MNIRHMEYLLELSRTLNFSAAAQKLGISQPTLTQALKKTETNLDVILFEREDRELKITEYGKVFLDACLYISDIYRDTVKKIDEMKHGRTGSIRVDIAPSRAPFTLPAALGRFRAFYPDVCVEITERLTADIEKNVETGLADLGILVVQEEENPRLTYIPIETERILIAAHRALVPEIPPAPAGDPAVETAPLAAFARVPFILLGEDQLIVSQFSAYSQKAGFDVNCVSRCRNIETSLSLANAGIGATLVTSTGMEYYRSAFPELRYFDAFGGTLTRQACLIYRKKQFVSEPCRKLIELLTEQNKSTDKKEK